MPKNNTTKDSYFRLSPEDRMEFELENKEKEEKQIITEKVFEKLNEKKSK